VEFAVLGPLEVRRGDDVLAVRRGRSRIVLISLLLRAGQVVPVDVLVEHAWGDRLPADSANALQVQISYLRRALRLHGDDGELRTVGAGYALRVAPERIDLHRFEHGVSSAADRLRTASPGDAEAALDELAAALRLWRGEPLQDVAYEPFAVAEVARLHELHAAALEYQVDARLLLGDHEQVVPMLHQLVGDHPLRERPRAQLMLALYRCGRQADALRAYDAARAALVEQLGVEPGRELQLLHQAVLTHDPDLDWVPPAPRAVTAPTRPLTRLPAPTTRLIGREREMARAAELLADNRMVTLTGPGGVGKTRLALAVAERLAHERPVWLVELAEVDDPAVVPYEVGRAVGVTDATDPAAAVQLRIGGAPGLVVLDTCEHLLEACAELSHVLLRACPALRILATSRQPMALPGEVAWPLRPLALAPVDGSFEQVRDAEAVRLFVDRARAVQPDFELDAARASDVGRICRILDGLPLAIELAAARVRVLSPGAILQHLDDRFALLNRVGLAADVRQRSLRTTIAWSYDLLDDEQRVFFARLGVFAGRFTYAAAADIAAAGLGTHPLDLLSAMVDRSLLVVDGDDSYRMLNSLRAFAAECLDRDPADRDAARGRLASWLAASCEPAERDLRGPAQAATLERLRAEAPNLRVALAWSFAGGDPAGGARLACSLSWFWALDGASDEGRRWLQQALRVPELDDELRARALEGLGIHTAILGAVVDGRHALRESVDLRSRSGLAGGHVAMIYLGVAHRMLGEIEQAAAAYDRAIAGARDHDDDWALGWALMWRARAATEQQDAELAGRLLAEARAAAERAGDRRILGWIILEVGLHTMRDGDVERALALTTEAVAIHEDLGSTPGLTASLSGLGRVLARLGRIDDAVAQHRRAVQTALQLGQRFAIAEALQAQADAIAAAGDSDAATELLGAADALRTDHSIGPTTASRDIAELEAALRSDLGDAGFADAFRRGQLRSPGEFV
jgi:predicted ATPase/DNA-binding SARP family transcriptional activator